MEGVEEEAGQGVGVAGGGAIINGVLSSCIIFMLWDASWKFVTENYDIYPLQFCICFIVSLKVEDKCRVHIPFIKLYTRVCIKSIVFETSENFQWRINSLYYCWNEHIDICIISLLSLSTATISFHFLLLRSLLHTLSMRPRSLFMFRITLHWKDLYFLKCILITPALVRNIQKTKQNRLRSRQM